MRRLAAAFPWLSSMKRRTKSEFGGRDAAIKELSELVDDKPLRRF